MNKDVKKYVTNCHQCHGMSQRFITQVQRHNRGHLLTIIPWTLLCIHFFKVDPSRHGKENVLVLTDACTKFSQAFVSYSQEALTIVKILVNKWFYVYGILVHIDSDHGQTFENTVISQMYTMYYIKQSMTMSHNPCGNFICERFNHTLLGLLQTLPEEQKTNWPLHIPSLVFAYNAMPHNTIGYQPYEL